MIDRDYKIDRQIDRQIEIMKYTLNRKDDVKHIKRLLSYCIKSYMNIINIFSQKYFLNLKNSLKSSPDQRIDIRICADIVYQRGATESKNIELVQEIVLI